MEMIKKRQRGAQGDKDGSQERGQDDKQKAECMRARETMCHLSYSEDCTIAREDPNALCVNLVSQTEICC